MFKSDKLSVLFVVILGFGVCLQLLLINKLEDPNGRDKIQNTEIIISNQQFQSKIGYQAHDPIKINSNSDFAKQVASEGWRGTGTLTDPYIISGLNITNPSSTLINISDTDVHFLIIRCFLMGNGPNEFVSNGGISCQNVTNGQIINNTIYYTSGDGIYVKASSYNYIAENQIHNTCGGIRLDDASNHCHIFNNEVYDVYDDFFSDGITVTLKSANNTLYGNTLYNNSHGIHIIDAPYNKIFSNIIFNNTEDGIYLRNAFHGLIYNNDVFSNDDNGIKLHNSSFNAIGSNKASLNGVQGEYQAGIYVFLNSNNNTITSNEVFYNSWYGISVSHSENNTIFHNKIHDNPNFGIDVNNNANYTLIRWNDLYRNFYPGLSLRQASDFGFNTTYEYNHWDSWTTPDVDLNGVVDKPFNITQDGTTIDPLPMVIPNNPYPHLLSNPSIILSSEGINLSEEIIIEWTPSFDSWGHSVAYDLYYSPGNGTTWFILAYDISTTSFTWNLVNLTSGNYSLTLIGHCSEGLFVGNMSSTVQIEKPIETIPSSSTVTHPSGIDNITKFSTNTKTTISNTTQKTSDSTEVTNLVLLAVIILSLKRLRQR